MATEKRLIDADALMKAIRSFRWIGPPNTLKLMFEYLWLIIRDQPTVDAVEVVRCKDCVNYRVFGFNPNERRCTVFDGANEFPYPTEPDDYCSYGERKDNE